MNLACDFHLKGPLKSPQIQMAVTVDALQFEQCKRMSPLTLAVLSYHIRDLSIRLCQHTGPEGTSSDDWTDKTSKPTTLTSYLVPV